MTEDRSEGGDEPESSALPECPCNNGDEGAVGAWIASLIDPLVDMAACTSGLMRAHCEGRDPEALVGVMAELSKAVKRVEQLRADYAHVELFHAEAAAMIQKVLTDSLPDVGMLGHE